MSKQAKIYGILGTLAVLLILVIEYNKPKKINWFPSYVASHKIPYGTKVLNTLLPKYFSNTEQVYRSPYEFLSRNDSIQGTYFFVNQSIEFGSTDLEELLDWTAAGNHLFIAAESFESNLLDTLNLEVASLYDASSLDPTFKHFLSNPELSKYTASFKKDYYTAYFSTIDTLKSVVFSEVMVDNDSVSTPKREITGIQQSFGEGIITLSTFPEAFTNYFLLKEEQPGYTSGLLTYIDSTEPLYVDNHHKAGKTFYTSPMYLFLNTRSFKWAYYMVLIGALVYIVFEGKRKQRAIPIIEPIKNQSLAFTRTIANMYFENNRQADIIQHKIQYFLEYIRTRFYLSTDKLDHKFFHALALRSNHSIEEVEAFFNKLKNLQGAHTISNNQLIQLEQQIQQFKAKVDGTK